MMVSVYRTIDPRLFCLFDLFLYVHGEQLRSCREGQLLNHTVSGQASREQLTNLKCPFLPVTEFRQLSLLPRKQLIP